VPSLFFPGATPWARRKGRNRCLWREEAFLLHLLQTAVNPHLRLGKCLRNWYEISLALREAPRKRELQMERLERKGDLLS